jgi:hypothetical protein
VSSANGHRGPSPEAEPTPEPVDLGRVAWSVTSIGFAIGALVLLMQGYYGYASVTFAVAVAAGINLL